LNAPVSINYQREAMTTETLGEKLTRPGLDFYTCKSHI